MAKRKSIMTPERKERIKAMLSSRTPMERDNTPLMNAANRAKTRKPKATEY